MPHKYDPSSRCETFRIISEMITWPPVILCKYLSLSIRGISRSLNLQYAELAGSSRHSWAEHMHSKVIFCPSRISIGFKSGRNRIIPGPNPGQNESLVMSVIYYPITLPLGQICHCLAFSESLWRNSWKFEFPSAFSMLLSSQQRILYKKLPFKAMLAPGNNGFWSWI